MHTVSRQRSLRRPMKTLSLLFLALVWSSGFSRPDDAQPPEGGTPYQRPEPSPQATSRREEANRHVFKERITAHWFANNTRFWYRNDLRGDTKEFIVVDATRGTREPAFDHAKLAAALSKAAQTDYRADKLPFNGLEFIDDG